MTEILRIARAEIAFEPWDWPFAQQRRGEIDRHFVECCRARPGVWNGRILLLNGCAVFDGVFRGKCFETDYASFLAWRDWNCPDRNIGNFFAAGALRASDGAYLLGQMGPHTANAGLIYFPCGMPEPDDLVGGRLDLAGSVAREFVEETGLDVADFHPEAGWTTVVIGSIRAFIRTFQATAGADELRERMLQHLASEKQPELSTIHIVRSAADLVSTMPSYVTAFLTDAWQSQR